MDKVIRVRQARSRRRSVYGRLGGVLGSFQGAGEVQQGTHVMRLAVRQVLLRLQDYTRTTSKKRCEVVEEPFQWAF